MWASAPPRAIAERLACFGCSRSFNPDGPEFVWNMFDAVIVISGNVALISGRIVGESGNGGFERSGP